MNRLEFCIFAVAISILAACSAPPPVDRISYAPLTSPRPEPRP